jgi:hypothetical protein
MKASITLHPFGRMGHLPSLCNLLVDSRTTVPDLYAAITGFFNYTPDTVLIAYERKVTAPRGALTEQEEEENALLTAAGLAEDDEVVNVDYVLLTAYLRSVVAFQSSATAESKWDGEGSHAIKGDKHRFEVYVYKSCFFVVKMFL